ncbi:hypothetical protein TIFTF001_020299 [Ficus carica]|uniref:Uncharacterized protein n=1 Tax=Ficus carica TaxID=3494 RepID=A0AA88DAX8_FICCA|nr:hypothetical protein TIFTF001_020299 [Ficus carica]
MAEEVKSAEADARSARRSEKEARAAKGAAEEARKKAEDRAKAAEERAKLTEEKLRFAEDWARKAEQDAEEAETSRWEMTEAMNKAERDLASARAEHERYLKVTLPAARAQAVEEYLQSEDFKARLVIEYQEGMQDIKVGFIATNPSLVGVDWSFVPEESEKIAVDEAFEEGEVSGAARLPENMVVLDDPGQSDIPEQAVALEQPVPPVQPDDEQPTTPARDFAFPDQLD